MIAQANSFRIPMKDNSRLTELETVIERGLQTFVEVGNALIEIRDERLYPANYGTFENYCRERWGMTKIHAYRLMGAATVIANLEESNQLVTLPANESQARPLAALPPDEQAPAWLEAVNTAPNGKVTGAHVQEVVNNYNYLRDNRRSQASDIYTPLGMDACQTPAYAVDPLLPYLPEGLNIWEPACGEGLLEDALIDSGFSVVSGDILTGQNFFDYEPERWDAIVTNPPYSIHFQWLERCYQLGKPFALLLKVEILGTKTAQEMFDQYGIEVIFVSPRINFKMPNKGWEGGGAQFPTAWFTWDLNIGKQMTFAKINAEAD